MSAKKMSKDKLPKKRSSLSVATPAQTISDPSSVPVEEVIEFMSSVSYQRYFNKLELFLQSASTKKNRLENQGGRLAICDHCGFRGTNLVMCPQCLHVFGPNVSTIKNPFRVQNRRGSSAIQDQNSDATTIKQEALEIVPQDSLSSSFISSSCDSQKDQETSQVSQVS